MFIHPLVDGPAIFQIGPIIVSFYGLMYLFSFIVYQALGEHRLKGSQCFTLDEFDVFFHYSVISTIVGGYIGNILFYSSSNFLSNFVWFPTDVISRTNLGLALSVWGFFYFLSKLSKIPPLSAGFLIIPLLFASLGDTGMSFHGALIGALIGVLFYSYKFNKDWLDIFDFTVPLIPPGLGLGRFANFVNGELWGRPTQMPWGVVFPRADFLLRHPSQLYECALEGAILFIILWNFSKPKRPKGAVFGLALALYAVFRSIVECFREPGEEIGFIAWKWLTMGQALSFPMLLGGLYFLLRAYFPFHKKTP